MILGMTLPTASLVIANSRNMRQVSNVNANPSRLQAFYYTVDECDFMTIAEGPSGNDVVAALLVAARLKGQRPVTGCRP